MTVKELRDALNLVAERHLDVEVIVWLPGTNVHIEKFMGLFDGKIMLEGARTDRRRD
ncbi:MAG TPA: hypothetical protein VFI76_08935 [Terrimicrobiaceae bacterium]|nr:hypothetical protein [Terrimicrobiaceae bacterium]